MTPSDLHQRAEDLVSRRTTLWWALGVQAAEEGKPRDCTWIGQPYRMDEWKRGYDEMREAMERGSSMPSKPPSEMTREIAQRFHEEYERLAPKYGWPTQERSRVAWENLPSEQKRLMCSVVASVLGELASRLAAAEAALEAFNRIERIEKHLLGDEEDPPVQGRWLRARWWRW